MRRLNCHDERGQVGGVEAIPFGILIFVVGALLIANAWAVVDAKMAVTAAAREAARTLVEAPSAADGRRSAAAAGRSAIAGYGRDPDLLQLELPADTGGFRRCGRIVITARYRVPAITLPWIGGFGDGFTVRATHTEVVDPFRRSLGGTADCA